MRPKNSGAFFVLGRAGNREYFYFVLGSPAYYATSDAFTDPSALRYSPPIGREFSFFPLLG